MVESQNRRRGEDCFTLRKGVHLLELGFSLSPYFQLLGAKRESPVERLRDRVQNIYSVAA